MIFTRLKDYYLALGSFILVLSITVYAYYVSKESDKIQDTKTFEIRTVQMKSALERRMGHYLQILRGVKGLFAASDTVTRQDFRRYLEALAIEKNYPGIQGIGFAIMLTPEEVPALEERLKNDGFPNFSVRPAGMRPEFSSIIFLEPMDVLNKRAHGFDMFNEPTRRQAMEAARDFNEPAMTAKLQLVQESGKNVQAGLLIYMPVYYGGDDPKDVGERRRLLKGFVYAPFRAVDLMTSTIGSDYSDIGITIYDGKEAKPENLLYTSDTTSQNLDSSGKDLFEKDVVRIAGRTWTLEFRPHRAFSNQNGLDEHNLILLAGGVISLLIFFVVWSLQRYLQSTQLTDLITKNTTAGLFMLDGRGYCTFQNPAAERMLGYTTDDLRQRPLHELVHRRKEAGELTPSLASSQSYKFEDNFICRDGNTIPVACAIRQVKQGGEVVGQILEVRNVVEEKKAQQALLESEARFRNMADSAPVMIWITDKNSNCTYVNRQWIKFTGATLEENLGKGWFKFIHPDDQKLATDVYNQASKNKEEFKVEYRLCRENKEYRGMVTTGIPRFNPEGEFLGYIGSVIDISDRIEMEQKLKQSAATLQKIFMQVPAIVGLVRTKDLVYTLVNSYLSSLYNGNAKVGEKATDSFPESQREQYAAVIQQIKETREPFIGKEVPVYFDESEGEREKVRYFNIVYEPIIDDRGEVESVLTFAVEVTEQVQSREKLSHINEELNRKNKELLRINNDLDSFVYTASHDLRSPLANLEGLTTALLENAEEKAGDEEDQELLNMVAASITKLKGTIHDLTEITKVQKDLETQAEELSFEQVLESVKDDISGMLQESEAELITSFEVPKLKYARRNLRSILYNLVSNAVKYRDPERRLQINVSTQRQNGCIVLTVQDNGLGIREDQQQKLFTMFRRFHSHVEGTGIGLYIVKRIIENNGGRIEVQSETGRGSTFTVYFKEE
ncbi:CHASE domain-containing protein [Rufibacter roseus]|uniref:histidine kinase n=1 Tax=Rufibacter roseus TaxID=1567108 RepID=A0ABW2DKP9_9BACT|nr:CHASE domain-containing protein [Rufibacter roseus]